MKINAPKPKFDLYDTYMKDPSQGKKALQSNNEAAEKMAEKMYGKNCNNDYSDAENMTYNYILGKLRSGQELSGYELMTLKNRNPALYAKAEKAQKARQELRTQLARAKTSKEFEQAKNIVASLTVSDLGAPADSTPPGVSSCAPTPAFEDGRMLISSALRNEYSQFHAKRDKVSLSEYSEKKMEAERTRKTEEKKRKEKASGL